MKNFLIIDGNNLLYRSYHIAEKLSNWENENKTIFIFLRIMMSLLRSGKYQKLLMIFDGGGKDNFRCKINENYKANRPKMPLILFNQFQIIQKIIKKTNLALIKLENYEADDLIASFITQNSNPKIIFYIFSQDKDLFQLLISKSLKKCLINICKYLNKKIIVYGYDDFIKEYNFLPSNYVDYLSLLGDRTDNILGAKGIGSKTARQIIEEFSTLENLYQNLHKIKGKEIKKSLENNKDLVFQNKQLILLKKDLTLPVKLTECHFSWEEWKKNHNLIEICKLYKFNSILKIIDS